MPLIKMSDIQKGQNSSTSGSSGLVKMGDISTDTSPVTQDQSSFSDDLTKFSPIANSPVFNDQAKQNASLDSMLNPHIPDFSQPTNQPISQPQVDNRSTVQQVLDYLFKENPVAKVVNYPFMKAAEYATPDQPYFGSTNPIDTPRQDLINQNTAEGIESTGNATYDKIGDYAGQLGSMFTPMGTGGALVNDIGKGTSSLLDNSRMGQAFQNALGKLGANSANLINPALNNAGMNLSTDLAQKAGQAFAKGATLGAGYGAVQPFAFGDGKLSDVPQSVAENAAMFGVGDAALPFAGAGLKALGDKIAGTKIGDAIGNFLSRNKVDAQEPTNPQQLALPPASEATMAEYNRRNGNVLPTNTDPILGHGDIHTPEPLGLPEGKYVTPSKLIPMGTQDAFAHVMEKVVPQATERMTPPLENQNELAKWVQGHLNDAGHDVSLNEVRGLNYEDLRQLSEEMKSRLQPYDVVRQTAHDMGYGRIFDETAPSIKDKIAADAQSRVYGVPAPKVNIARPDSFNVQHVSDAAMPETKVKFDRPVAENPVDNGKPLNVDAKQPQPIKLTPKEVLRNERIDQFSKIEDNPTLPNTMDQIQSKTTKESIPLSQRVNEAYIKTVDNAHRTNQFDQAAKEANNGELKPSDSAYMLQLNARGHDMQASQIVNKNMINAKGEVTGQSLADITKQIPKDERQKLNDYEVAKHSITRMENGQKVYKDDKNMTIQKAKMIVENYDKTNPNFKDIAAQHTKFSQDFAQQWYVDTGLFKQEQMDKAFADNPNYVSNKRIFSDLEKNLNHHGNGKGGVVDQTNPVKRYNPDGSQRKIVDPFESTMEDIERGVKTAKNNEAGQAIVRSLQRNPDELSSFARIIGKDENFNVDEMIQKEGLDGTIEHLNKQFEDATRNFNPDKGNIVTVMMNGEPIKVEIYDPQFLEAISNLSPKGQDYVTNAVGKMTKVMKTVTTGVNPIFGLTRNVPRDIVHAYVSSKTINPFNPLDRIRFAADLVDGLTSVLADSISHSDAVQSKYVPDFLKGWIETRGNLYNDYKNMGGGHSSAVAADRNLLAQSKEKILPSSGVIQSLKRNLITKPYHALENINNAAEAAPRLGEYKRVVKAGGGTYDAKVKGLYEANDLTVNFNKYGNVTKNVDAYVPYLNAAVQGLDQLTRMGTQGGAKRLTQVYAKALEAITIPSVITYLMFHNDPDYQQLSNYVKDNYLMISKNADGTFNKVAKPRELGMVFGTSVERVLRSYNEHDPRAFQDFTTNFLQNFLPPMVSGAAQGASQSGVIGALTGATSNSIFAPINQLASNKDFANRPIVPQDLLGASPRNQFDSKTSEPAKFIGDILNVSPKQLDFLVKSYGGIIGQLGIPLATKGTTVGQALQQQVTADPTYSNDISRNFYDQKAKSDMAKKDASLTGVPATDDMSKYYDKMATKFSKIRKDMKAIQNDDSLSRADKRSQLDAMQKMLNAFQQQSTQ